MNETISMEFPRGVKNALHLRLKAFLDIGTDCTEKSRIVVGTFCRGKCYLGITQFFQENRLSVMLENSALVTLAREQ